MVCNIIAFVCAAWLIWVVPYVVINLYLTRGLYHERRRDDTTR